jgi:hypothetical protein
MVRKKYKTGDFFIIPLDGGKQKGYGRIVGIHKGLKAPAVEYYKVNPRENYSINELLKTEYIKRILCSEAPFRNGNWKIIGNISIEHSALVFWQFHFHFEKYLIIDEEGDIVKSVGENEIKADWVEYSVCDEEALVQKYSHYLKECGLLSPT